jgi:hypothetical protein
VLGQDGAVRVRRGRGVVRPLTAALAAPACLLLGGCLPLVGGSGEDAATPQVGQCYDTPDAVLPDASDPTAPVDCAEPHTLQTYAVLEPDAPLDAETMLRMDEQCTARIEDFLGGDFLHTAVSVYYFRPTREQQRQGARWVRCDAGVVTDTAVSGARTVEGSLEGAFTDGVPLEYRRCLDAPPDPTSPQPLVPCEEPHVAQQLPAGVDLQGARDAYPGTEALAARANPLCARAISADLPEAARSLIVVPTRQMWTAGIRSAQCWGLAGPGERLGGSEAQPA